MTTKFLTIDQVIEIHDTFLQLYGGLSGIRSHGLLASAVEIPRATMFGEDVHPTLFDKTAAYLYHILNLPLSLDMGRFSCLKRVNKRRLIL